MNLSLSAARGPSLATTGGLVALGALVMENLVLCLLLLNPGAPALLAVLGALVKAVVVVMMHQWPALVAAAFGVALLAYLGLSACATDHPLPEDGL